jgi:hypothetical protein
MRTWLLVVGIIILIVEGGIAGFGGSSPSLVDGITVLVVGIILAVIGAATGRPRAEAASPPAASRPVAQGMTSGTMDDMVRMLASAPEAQSGEMIKTRLSSFSQMNDAERADAMKMMIGAVQKLDQESIRKLTYTRIESLAEDFDALARKRLMGTHIWSL